MEDELKNMSVAVEVVARKMIILTQRANGCYPESSVPPIRSTARLSIELSAIAEDIENIIDAYFEEPPAMGKKRPF